MKLPTVLVILMSSVLLGCATQPKTLVVEKAKPLKERVQTHPKTIGVEKAKPPLGWAEFCVRYAPECANNHTPPRDIVLSPDTWSTIVSVNKRVNEYIKPTTDLEHWGAINIWYYPDDGRGDCKAYVLLKRRMLMEAGFPRQALLITIVGTQEHKGHAVLIARTDKGDFVLDNLSAETLLWSETDYDFIKRQSQSDPNAWIYIDGDTWKQPATVAATVTD